jgi:hypothetical protein
MNFLKHSFFYYLIALTLLTTVDFKEVHYLRLAWFEVLMTLSSPQERPKVGVMLYDYLVHLDPADPLYQKRLAESRALLADK